MGVKGIFRKNRAFLLVFLLSLIPLTSLLPNGLPVTHDGQDHIARIANFYSSLSEGNIVPRWAENLNWGFGHPVMMFLYPLSSYAASFFHFFGFGLIDSVKLVFGISYILSGLTMFLWLRNQFDDYIGTAGSILYLYAPYRFVDIYVRGALGEHVAFVFLPLSLYGIYKFYNSKRIFNLYLYFVLISFSIALLVLSHNALSLMFLPVIILYCLYLSFVYKNSIKVIYVTIAIVTGILLSAFFIFPAFFEGKYTLRDIVTNNEYKERFVNFARLIYSPWSYKGTGQFSEEIGILHLIGLLISPFVFLKAYKRKSAISAFIVGTLFLYIFSVFMQISISNFIYESITVFQKFQFPWRFLSLTVFAGSVLASVALFHIKSREIKKVIIAAGILILLVVSYEKFQANGYLKKSDNFYKSIYQGTTDTGESAPIWSVRFMESKPDRRIEVISGSAVVKEVFRNSTNHSYLINVNSDSARIRENTLYFPGWKVLSNNENMEIEFQDPSNRGLITFNLEKGANNVKVTFGNTRMRMFSEVLSLLTLFSIFVVGLLIYLKYERKKNKKKFA